MLNFSKKIKKNTWRYYFTPVYQKYWWYDPQFLRYRVWMTEIGHYESFYALLPLPIKTKKIRILKKKKNYRRYHHFICAPKTTIIWGTLLEIQSESDRIFVILSHFCPFTPSLPPLTTQKIQILKKWKKMPGDIIILHMCTINETHVMYCSWDKKCDRQNLFSLQKICFHLKENP